MRRVVFTVAFGAEDADYALGLGRSLKLIGDETPRGVFTDQPHPEWSACFSHVWSIMAGRPIRDLLVDLEAGGYEVALFVDPASLGFRRIAPIFELEPSARWLGFRSQLNDAISNRILRFSVAAALASPKTTESLPGRCPFASICRDLGSANEEGLVVAERERQFYASPYSPGSRIRLDVKVNLCRFISLVPQPRLFTPYLYGPTEPRSDRGYLRQLRTLSALARYEQRYGFGRMSTGHKFRRSIEKRILRLQGKI